MGVDTDRPVALACLGNDEAITGGLLGARWGRSAIPLAWQRLLHGCPGSTRDLTTPAVRIARTARALRTQRPRAVAR